VIEESFRRHRNLLFTIAYEMLGSSADAEDVVQETWLRWAEVDPDVVRDPRAVFVLREVFDLPFDEIADAVGKSSAAVRQIAHRARLDVLAPDVVVVADGGGLAPAARRPIQGAERVARALLGGLRAADVVVTPIWLNGSPGGRVEMGGEVGAVVSFAVENGRITRIYAVSNPHKLARLNGVAPITRT